VFTQDQYAEPTGKSKDVICRLDGDEEIEGAIKARNGRRRKLLVKGIDRAPSQLIIDDLYPEA
jgi:hypothetical protein